MTCSADCRYKRLYEGTQASLNDLAGKQAAALTRAGKLRNAVLDAGKQFHPDVYAEAERSLGTKLSKLSDEMIIAYLNSFMAVGVAERKAARATPPSTPTEQVSPELDAIRTLLTARGVTISESAGAAEWVSVLVPLLDKGAGDAHVYGVAEETNIGSSENVVVTPGLLHDLFGEVHIDVPPPDEPSNEDYWDDLFSEDPQQVSGTVNALGDIFSDGRAPAPVVGAANKENSGLDTPDLNVSRQTQPVETLASVSKTEDKAPADQDVVAETFEGIDESVKNTTETKVAHAAPKPAQPQGEQLGFDSSVGSVRPEIIAAPARPNRKKPARKTTRLRAEPPESKAVTVAKETSLPANDGESLALNASHSRPLFTSDLTSAGVSADEVSALEEAAREAGTGAEYAFIIGKADRGRGSLIVPTRPKQEPTPWGACLVNEKLRGQTLYEIAIILRNNEETVLSCEVRNSTTLFTFSSLGTGLHLGVFVGAGGTAPGSPLRAELTEIIASSVNADYESVVLLTSSRRADAPARLASSVADLATENSWDVRIPVLAGHSGTYRGPANSSLVHALP
jgi:hypothetical protein